MDSSGSEHSTSKTPTPQTPAELASIQGNDEARLVDGVDLSTKARALYYYADELSLSIHELIGTSYCLLRRAEYALDQLVKEEIDSHHSHPHLQAIYHWCVASGGLTSIRLTLQSMLETAGDAGLWKTCPPWEQREPSRGSINLETLQQQLDQMSAMKNKGLISEEECRLLRLACIRRAHGAD